MPNLNSLIITLSNGKRVANFSSPHAFTFEDDTVLPAVSNKEAEALKLKFNEKEYPSGDVELSFELTQNIDYAMGYWLGKFENDQVDVVFCPMPMIIAIRQSDTWGEAWLISESPFRAIRMVDRITKKVSINKQCI